jgi:homogentisate 1,2-dioxygenase
LASAFCNSDGDFLFVAQQGTGLCVVIISSSSPIALRSLSLSLSLCLYLLFFSFTLWSSSGALDLVTEFGRLHVAPLEIAVVPV